MLRGVADLTTLSLAEDRRLMEIVFELEEVPGGIFEKEGVVFDARAGEPHAGLLIEGQTVRLGLFQELLPRVFRQEDEAEMVGINSLLRGPGFRR